MKKVFFPFCSEPNSRTTEYKPPSAWIRTNPCAFFIPTERRKNHAKANRPGRDQTNSHHLAPHRYLRNPILPDDRQAPIRRHRTNRPSRWQRRHHDDQPYGRRCTEPMAADNGSVYQQGKQRLRDLYDGHQALRADVFEICTAESVKRRYVPNPCKRMDEIRSTAPGCECYSQSTPADVQASRSHLPHGARRIYPVQDLGRYGDSLPRGNPSQC